ncbi:MAG: hypothetical protein H6719_06365 [Sandaracinaceae bacterium]|nr:hypothetical protein [Sandaracinaceae bacterium]
MRLASIPTLAIALALGGCFVVTPGHRDDVLNNTGTDAGTDGAVPPGTDAGVDGGGSTNLLVDSCGDSSATYEILRDSRSPFIVDTTSLVNRVSTCGTGASPGNDGFLAVEVTAGDLWHFHVIPDPATPGQDRDPFLYLVLASGSSCDTRACQHSSNSCLGGGDEHFAFVAPEDGIWYLGIDDANPGGGVYQIEAIRLQCGDGMKVHGEACDGSATCSSSCQEILSETRPNEVEANDNPIEANFVEIPSATNEITLSGNIGGGTCTYPDVFDFRIGDDNSALTVDILKSDGTVCDNASLTPFNIILRSSAGETRAGPMTDPVTGCAQLRVTGLSAAAYYVYLEHDAPIEDRIVPYQVRLRVTPP